MISNYSTRTLIKFDKHHCRNILVLKPNCEFLMWEFPSIIANSRYVRRTKRNNRRVKNINGFLLFYRHYLAAQKKYMQRPIRNGVEQSVEIRKTWNCAGKQIHDVYEKLAFQLKFGNYLNIQTYSIKSFYNINLKFLHK